ncbi:hypothetical protein BX600DRAFT_376739 [Xylariales sp. PMI_506]|nr:hypothetical protein BX600DRAFT_376739 [Xylariales sp. PMI_506]
MELEPLASHPLLPARYNSVSRKSAPKRNLSIRNQRIKKGVSIRDSKTGRSQSRPLGAQTEQNNVAPATKPKARLSPITVVKPLLPASERRTIVGDGKVGKSKKDGDADKWDITPDGGSASREGRQFTIANVGNNGKIYLRPTVRPANQRYPQPQFVFPAAPPAAASLDVLGIPKSTAEDASEGHSTQLLPSPLSGPLAPTQTKTPFRADSTAVTPQTRPRRAMSDSTIRETSGAQDSEADVFKVVITKPVEEPKSKTTEDIDPSSGPFLQISIPSWKLGTPRFTLQGTPLIRGSSYAPTEEFRTSNLSFFSRSRADVNLNSLHPEFLSSKKQSPILMPQIRFPADILSPVSPKFPDVPRATYLSTHLVIEPAMFDSLTFKPSCDDKSIVRYATMTGAVTAATPPRLVAEITSPSFLDYELISDFFLTFRSFLETEDLLRMLVARLQWAMAREDEVGMVVRVRAFVAMRHWILNYFVDDFVVDHQLRVTFCKLINDLVDELASDSRDRKLQLKILGELKKCWRRVCSQYWDGPEFDADLNPEVSITPGGIAGHRNPILDPSFWESDSSEPPQIYELGFPRIDTQVETSFYNEVDKAGRIDIMANIAERPRTPDPRPVETLRHQTASPTSVASIEVLSCSFPTKGFRMADPMTSHPLGAHPVEPSSLYTTLDPIASTPRALTGKRVRAQTPQVHKRSNSLSDSLREHANSTEKVVYKNAEFLLAQPYAGSLVRGNLLPPGQAFVEVAPDSLTASRDTIIFQPQAHGALKYKGGSAMSGQGMKKLLGSVRRALSHRQGSQAAIFNTAPIGPRGITTNRLPVTAIVPQMRPSRPTGSRPAVRIDILAAEIAEDFQNALREDAAEEQEENDINTKITAANIEYSAAHLDSSFELKFDPEIRPFSDGGITTGSKSIVIVDGTLPPEMTSMSGALPGIRTLNPSVEAFADSFLTGTGADPTPPNTPPPRVVSDDIPRRSSYILGKHVVSLESDPLPPFIPDLATLQPGKDQDDSNTETRPSIDQPLLARPSFDHIRKPSLSRPPPASIRYLGHRRQQSSRSFRSRGSIALRRRASMNSLIPRSTIRSFDASTLSEGSIASEIMPPPLRVLRRRPGGDLRGAQNVADLDGPPLHRSHSTGSLTTYSESLRSSFIHSPHRDSSGFVDIVSSDFSQHRGDVFSLGAIAEKAPQRHSHFSTHSSKPIMRPSFEAEAQKLAQIPDDVDDDGGVESALAKLEGKVLEKKPLRLSMEPRGAIPIDTADEIRPDPITEPDGNHRTPEKTRHRHEHVGEEVVRPLILPTHTAHAHSIDTLDVPQGSDVRSFLSDVSRESYNSIPLLERGLTDDGRSKRGTQQWADQSVLEDEEDEPQRTHMPIDSNAGESGEEQAEQKAPKRSEVLSFLDVGSDNDSVLSSELSVEADEFGINPAFKHKKTETPTTTDLAAIQAPSESPVPLEMTLTQALQLSPETARVPELHEFQIWSQKPLPPTPDMTPTNVLYHQHLASPDDPTGTKEALRNAPPIKDPPSSKYSVHLPFILGFDSEILAQQFTLIEKDALNEVDWKELIDMRWKNSHTDSRSWVDFLRNSDARGVEVVVARFNIMVKWVISEIVLTQDDHERARCLIKFLHIASHCRRYRNFATLSQIAIALTSNEIARLTRTWGLLPAADLRIFEELENLVSPTKNFFNLRGEMESASVTPDVGCIPFVGIYTHDLLFNSQRPSEIAGSPTTAPLVNFERCRIAAAVVKTLLRLLEASTLYQFQPIEGITERCLWMSALSDDEIRQHSENIEPTLV